MDKQTIRSEAGQRIRNQHAMRAEFMTRSGGKGSSKLPLCSVTEANRKKAGFVSAQC